MKILLAVDDSAFSEAATKAVIDQTKPGDLEVHVLHTFEPMAFLPGFAGESVACFVRSRTLQADCTSVS